MARINIWPEKISEQEGQVCTGFTLEREKEERLFIWYRLPIELSTALSKGCESFLLASMFTAMRSKADIFVHGEVSPILLSNLEEFQAAWALWYPNLYTPIEIRVEIEQEQLRPITTAAISSFSGGVDSCYTVWRHKHGKAGRNNQNLRAGLFLHGMDIPLGRVETYQRAAIKAKNLLNSLGLEMIPMVVNLKKLGDNIAHSQGAFLASCLMLLQSGFTSGLIAGSHSYSDLYFPWSSNPITDPLLSSEAFPIIYDSADVPRSQKISEINSWPEIQQNLRVCLGKNRDERDKNCCRCEKCIRTILNFRALNLGLPACFEQDVSLGQIVQLGLQKVKFPDYYKKILEEAKSSQVTGAWIHAVKWLLLSNQVRRAFVATPIIRRIHHHITHRLQEIRTYSRRYHQNRPTQNEK